MIRKILVGLIVVGLLAGGFALAQACPGNVGLTKLEINGVNLQYTQNTGTIGFQTAIRVEWDGDLAAIQLTYEFNSEILTPTGFVYNEGFSSHSSTAYTIFNGNPPFGPLCTTCPPACWDVDDTFLVQVFSGATEFEATSDNILGWVQWTADVDDLHANGNENIGTIVSVSCGERYNGQLTSFATFTNGPGCQETWTDWAVSGAIDNGSGCILLDHTPTSPSPLNPVDYCPGCTQPGQCPWSPTICKCQFCCSLSEKAKMGESVTWEAVKSLYKEDD